MKKYLVMHTTIIIIAIGLFFVMKSSAVNVNNCPNGTTMLTQGSTTTKNIDRSGYLFNFEADIDVTLNCDLDEPIQGINASAKLKFTDPQTGEVRYKSASGASHPGDPALQNKNQTKTVTIQFIGGGYSGWDMTVDNVNILGADFDTTQ